MSNGCTVTLEFIFNPGVGEAFSATLPEMLKETAKRPGFRNIRVVRHNEDPDRILLIEQWDSEQHYQDYLAWRRERGDMDNIASAVKSMQLNFWPQFITSL